MRIRQSRHYDRTATEYQYQMVRLLDAALKDSGLPENTRRDVCERFILDHARLHDAGSLPLGNKVFVPLLAFLDGEDLSISDGQFELEEYAYGNVEEYFENEGREAPPD